MKKTITYNEPRIFKVDENTVIVCQPESNVVEVFVKDDFDDFSSAGIIRI